MIESFKNSLLSLRKYLSTLTTKRDLQETEKHIMSAITDWVTSEQASLTAIQNELSTIATGVATLDAMIIALQNSPGTLSASDQAALDSIQTVSATLLQQAQAINIVPPVATPTNGPATAPTAGVATATTQAANGTVGSK